jgi:hypothetical protein
MVKQNEWAKISKLRKILRDKKTRLVRNVKKGKTYGGVSVIEGSDLFNRYSTQLAVLESKMVRDKRGRYIICTYVKKYLHNKLINGLREQLFVNHLIT